MNEAELALLLHRGAKYRQDPTVTGNLIFGRVSAYFATVTPARTTAGVTGNAKKLLSNFTSQTD